MAFFNALMNTKKQVRPNLTPKVPRSGITVKAPPVYKEDRQRFNMLAKIKGKRPPMQNRINPFSTKPRRNDKEWRPV